MEDEIRDASPQERRAVRLEKAPPIWKSMKRRALQLRADPRVLPRSTLGKAVKYFLNEYTPFRAKSKTSSEMSVAFIFIFNSGRPERIAHMIE